jgi:hypothetical protein
MLTAMLMVTIKVKLPVILIAAVILIVILILKVAAIVSSALPRPPISLTLLPSPPPNLDRALDDSVLAKLQPVEQMEKMQKVLEAFQAQVQDPSLSPVEGYMLPEALLLARNLPFLSSISSSQFSLLMAL